MDIREKYYELEDVIEDIDRIIWKLQKEKKEMQDYIDQLYETMWQMQKEVEQLESEVVRIENEDEEQQEKDYQTMQLGGMY